MKKKLVFRSVNDPELRELDKNTLSQIRGGQEEEEYTCSSNAETDRTYVTINTDQIYHGDGTGKGETWCEDIGDIQE